MCPWRAAPKINQLHYFYKCTTKRSNDSAAKRSHHSRLRRTIFICSARSLPAAEANFRTTRNNSFRRRPPASIFNCRVKIKQQIWMSLCVQGHKHSFPLNWNQNRTDVTMSEAESEAKCGFIPPEEASSSLISLLESFLPFLWRTALFYSQRWKELRISAWFLFGRERRFKAPFWWIIENLSWRWKGKEWWRNSRGVFFVFLFLFVQGSGLLKV